MRWIGGVCAAALFVNLVPLPKDIPEVLVFAMVFCAYLGLTVAKKEEE